MKKIVLIVFSIIISILFSSCFETIEEINIKNDGSGSMVLTFNGSQSKAKIASLMKLKSVNGHKIPSVDEIKTELAQAAAQLRSIPGISNVKTNADFQNYIITVSYDFKDVSQINTAFNKMLTNFDIPTYNAPGYSYNKTNKAFAKVFILNAATKKQFNELKAEDKEVFQNAQYTSVYRFENIVQSTKNANSKISNSKKSVMQRIPIVDIINSKQTVDNVIKLQ